MDALHEVNPEYMITFPNMPLGHLSIQRSALVAVTAMVGAGSTYQAPHVTFHVGTHKQMWEFRTKGSASA